MSPTQHPSRPPPDPGESVAPEPRSLNLPATASLLLAVVVVAGGLYLLHRFQMRRQCSSLLRHAKSARQRDDFEKATSYLTQYLRFRPDDTEALADLAVILQENATSNAARWPAFHMFGKVLSREPQRDDIRRRLVQAAMDLERFADARNNLEVLRRNSPDDAELEQTLGRCHESLREFEEAAGWYEKALSHAPELIDSYARLADLWRRRLDRSKDEADELIDRMVEANPQLFEAYLARMRYRSDLGSLQDPATLDANEQDVSHARELAPADPGVILATADVALARAAVSQAEGEADRAQAALEQARQLLSDAVQQDPQELRYYQALAGLERQAGRINEAVQWLDRGLAAMPGQSELRWHLADLLIDRGELRRARELMLQLRQDRRVTAGPVRYLEARILLDEQQPTQWHAVAAKLEEARPLLQEIPQLAKHADLLLGDCYGQLLDPARQLPAYRRALQVDPFYVPARLGVASTLVTLGDISSALSEYRPLAERMPALRATVARLLLLQTLRLPESERIWHEVDSALDRAAEVAPQAIDVQILRAQAMEGRGERDQAGTLLRAARDAQPEQVEIWIAFVDWTEQQEGIEPAMALLDEAREQLGDAVELRLARARHWSRRGPHARGSLLELARDAEQLPAKIQSRLFAGLAEAFARAGEALEAVRCWKEVATREPYNLRARFLWFEQARLAGDEAEMDAAFEQLRLIEGPDGPLSHYAEAARLISLAQRGDAQARTQARSMAASLAARWPSWSASAALQAQVGELDDNPQLAIAHYLRAIDLGEHNPAVLFRAVQLLCHYRRFVEASQLLSKLGTDIPTTGDWDRWASEVAFRTNDLHRALNLARKAAAYEPKNHHYQIWLGSVLTQLALRARAERLPEAEAHRSEAEQVLLGAVKLAEDNPEVWVALVMHFAAMGLTEQAEATVKQAELKIPAAHAPLALAQCYELIGRPNHAATQYRAALAANPRDQSALRTAASFFMRTGSAAPAEQLLRRLLDESFNASDIDVAWARRMLALLLSGANHPLRLAEALTLIQQNTNDGTADIEDLRAEALVLARQNSRRQRRQAIRLFERLFAKQSPPAQQQFLLAQLYEGDGSWQQARAQFQRLFASGAANTAHLSHYVQSLIRHRELDAAESCVARLEHNEPDSLMTISAKARLLAARGAGDSAVDSLLEYLDGPAVAADSDGSRRMAVASLLEELGQSDAAGEVYRKLDSLMEKPDARAAVASYLARHGQLAEAVDLCESLWQTAPADFAARTCLTVLRSGSAGVEHCRRVSDWLDSALRATPDDIALLVHLADLRDLEGRFDDAAKIYRRVLARDARHAVALNNLAWLLAQKMDPDAAAEALALVNRAIELGGPLPELLDTRAVVQLALGHPEPAILDLDDAIDKTVPDDAAALATLHFYFARSYVMAKNSGAAAIAFRKARASGLAEHALHPLEREAYRALTVTLSASP